MSQDEGQSAEGSCWDCLLINIIQDDPGPILITQPCVFHGPHEGHELLVKWEVTLKGRVGGWYCYTCEEWCRDD